jgi:hypothetical protein
MHRDYVQCTLIAIAAVLSNVLPPDPSPRPSSIDFLKFDLTDRPNRDKLCLTRMLSAVRSSARSLRPLTTAFTALKTQRAANHSFFNYGNVGVSGTSFCSLSILSLPPPPIDLTASPTSKRQP